MPAYYAPRRQYTTTLKLLAGVAAIILIYLRLSSLVDSHFAKSRSAPEVGKYGRKSIFPRGNDFSLNGTLPTEILQRRALTWEAAIEKGRRFDTLLRAPLVSVVDPQHSNYVLQKTRTFQYSDLARYGWVLHETTVAQVPPDEGRPFDFPDAALSRRFLRTGNPMGGIAMGGRAEADAAEVRSWMHIRESTVQGEAGEPPQVFKATRGFYRVAYAWGQGVLTSFSALSPGKSGAGQRGSDARGVVPPPLEHWSDVIFLTLADHVQQSRQLDLSFIIREAITTEDTKDIIFHAVRQIPWGNPGPPLWGTRCVFSILTGARGADRINSLRDGFYALMGTPHGEGVARLFLEHKACFPTTYVKSITVFHHETDTHLVRFNKDTSRPTLVFELAETTDPDSDGEESLDSPPSGTSPTWSAASSGDEAGPAGQGDSSSSGSDNGNGSS